mmetsp:Transcript_28351/g.44080  ORF Transcript_28351/g.44080 Transcript_28351/m.44080 type:complete len:474 (+) Transcript_28351:15-1436(+)
MDTTNSADKPLRDYVLVSIDKPDPSYRLGIVFAKSELNPNKIVIRDCNWQRSYSQYLKEGYEVLKVSSIVDPRRLLSNPGIYGTATEEYEVIAASAIKPSSDVSDIGIKIKQLHSNHTFIITDVDSLGLFASSPLRAGDEIISINNVSLDVRDKYWAIDPTGMTSSFEVPKRIEFVHQIIADAHRSVAIVAKRHISHADRFIQDAIGTVKIHAQGPDEFIAATVYKPFHDVSTGIRFRASGKDTVISGISETSLFQDTVLCEGDKILSVNNTDCSRLKIDDVANLVRNATGNVAILAKREGETAHATFMKDRQDIDVGFCLMKLGRDVVVRGISSTSPCYGSLIHGHKIKSIEIECECNGRMPAEVARFIKNAPQKVMLYAQDPVMNLLAQEAYGRSTRNLASDQECPLCMSFFSSINSTECCNALICSTCFLNHKHKYNRDRCPYCVHPGLTVKENCTAPITPSAPPKEMWF